MVLYILIFVFLERRWDNKRLNRMVACIPQIQPTLYFFMNAIFICYNVNPKYLNVATLSKDLLAISKQLFCPTFW